MNTLSTYATEYLEHCEYRKHLDIKTLKAYRIDLKQFEAFSSDTIDFYDKNHVDSYLTFLHKQYKPKSIKRKPHSQASVSFHLVSVMYPLSFGYAFRFWILHLACHTGICFLEV